MSLTRKLTGAFVLLSIFVVVVVSVLAFTNGRRALNDKVREYVSSVSLLKEGQFINWIDANSQSLGRMAQRPLIADLTATVANQGSDPDAFIAAYDRLYNNHLTQLVRGSLGFYELYILHPETGEIFMSSDPAQVGKFREDQPFFEIGRSTTYVQSPYYSLTRQDQIITIATPIRSSTNDLVGVLAGNLDLEVARDIMTAGFVDHATGDTFIVNRFNFYVTDSRFTDPSQPNSAIHSAGVDTCLAQQTDTTTYVNHAGVRVIGAYRWIEPLALCIVTEIQTEEAFASIDALRNTIFWASAMVVVLGGGLGVAFSRSLTRPLHTLVEGTRAIGQGDLAYRVGSEAQDEIGELSRSFDEMVGNLQAVTASRDDLNAEIERRNQAEATLRERETTLALSLEAAKAGIWEWDIAGGGLTWDAAVEAMHGLEAGTFSGNYEDWVALVHPDDMAEVEKALQQTLKEDKPYVAEMRAVRHDGQVTPMLSQAVVERDDDGIPLRMTGIAMDITEVKRTEAALRERESTLSISLKAAGAGVWTWDIASGLITWDPATEEMHGLVVGSFGGTFADWQAGVHPEDLPGAEEAVQNALAGIKPFDETFRIIRPNGDIRHILAQAVVTRDKKGEPTGMIGINIDVTERIESEQALAKLSFSLNERVKELHCIQDIGKYEEADSPLYIYMEKVVMRIPPSMQYPGDCLVAITSEGELYGDEVAINCEPQICEPIKINERHSGGLWVAYEQDHPFLNEEFNHVKEIAIRIGNYLTRRQLDEDLRETMKDLEKSNKELERFAYVASHDLQEPLRMVSSYLQLFKKRYEGQIDEKADTYIYYAVDGANRMKVLINDLLTFSRVTTRGGDFVETSMDDVMGQVRQDLTLLVEETGATLTADPLPTLMVDGSQMHQLLLNLISNAIKFQGEAAPVVHVGAVQREEHWEISVEDNGIGIDPEYFDQIFVIFKRLHTREQYEGTGIGLAVCRRIVERHGGSIRVESEPGAGSKFIITLPVEEQSSEYVTN